MRECPFIKGATEDMIRQVYIDSVDTFRDIECNPKWDPEVLVDIFMESKTIQEVSAKYNKYLSEIKQ